MKQPRHGRRISINPPVPQSPANPECAPSFPVSCARSPRSSPANRPRRRRARRQRFRAVLCQIVEIMPERNHLSPLHPQDRSELAVRILQEQDFAADGEWRCLEEDAGDAGRPRLRQNDYSAFGRKVGLWCCTVSSPHTAGLQNLE